MVKLRLRRMGRANSPFFRIVAVDARVKRDGKYLEQVGIYDPKKAESNVRIDDEKAIKWLNYGAQPTQTVRSLLSKLGIMKKFSEMKLLSKQEKKNEKGAENEGN